jgi:(S)-ureidoglycine-glyoxylate aminotransferase
MTLVTYSVALDAELIAQPPTSYLDLRQLQDYWSPERLNHHTAPTSLVYGLREALRLVLAEGLQNTIERHQAVGAILHSGLRELGLTVSGDPPYAVVDLPSTTDARALRTTLRDDHGIAIASAGPHRVQFGLLGADATPANARRVILALRSVLA